MFSTKIKAACLCAMICVLSMGRVAFAQDGIKIGIFNMQRVMMESKIGKESKIIFDKELEAKRVLLEGREKELKALDVEYKKVVPQLKPEAKKIKEGEFLDQLKGYKKYAQDTKDELQKRDIELASKVLKEAIEVAKKIGEEGKYTVIFQSGPQVIYADKTIDITDEVIKRCDAQYQNKRK